jgi:hypothetical protein
VEQIIRLKVPSLEAERHLIKIQVNAEN